MKRFLLLMLFSAVSINGWAQSSERELINELRKFGNFIGALNQIYVDTLNNKLMIEDAIRGVLSQLDPHSSYIPANQMQQVKEEANGNFEGIGIEFSTINDTIIVTGVISGGPAEKVGIMPNDKIVKVNGENFIGIKATDVSKYLRGPKGSTVTLTVSRAGAQQLVDFKITRDKIPLYTVDAAYKVNESTGYVRINRFAATTNDELTNALDKMKGIQNLILDLRGNGGGLLKQAVAVCSQFIEAGKVVVSMEGLRISPQTFKSNGKGYFLNGKLCVLVDELTASASEIVAGAIQDWDRGLIVGRPTYGKGLVQNQFRLQDGSAVRITTARYHTPSGRVIQRPFERGKKDKYSKGLFDRLKYGEKIDSTQVPDSLKYQTLVKGRTVWGGGGIVPDVIVPTDTTDTYTKYYRELLANGAMAQFLIGYMERFRTQLIKQYPTEDDFIKNYMVGQREFDLIVEYGNKNKVKFNQAEFDKTKKWLQISIKALIGERLFTRSTYYRIMNDSDSMMGEEFRTALKTFEN